MKKRDTAAVLPGFSTARTPAKLDTTGLTGKDRILMLAAIIKSFESGRKVQYKWSFQKEWIDVDIPSWLETPGIEYRIAPIIATVYVNLYDPELGTGDDADSTDAWWVHYHTEKEAREGAIPGAFAVAVPVTIEE